MKAISRAIFIFLLFSLAPYVNAQDDAVVTLYDLTRANGNRETYRITEQSASRVPDWFPEKDEKPPLSIPRAITLAKEWAKKQSKDSKPDIQSIRIWRIKWPEMMNKWFYIIDLSRYVQGRSTDGLPVVGTTTDSISVVVLMDGSVVGPLITKRQ